MGCHSPSSHTLDPCIGLRGGRCRLLFIATMIVGALLGLFEGLGEYDLYTELRDHGLITNGTITRLEYTPESCSESCSDARYDVSYTYEVAQGTYCGTINDEGLYQTHAVGDTMSIIHSPDDPSRHKVVGKNTFSMAGSAFRVLIFAVFVGPMVSFFLLWVFIYGVLNRPMYVND